MTNNDAKNMLLTFDLDYLHNHMPCGITVEQAFDCILDICDANELNTILEKYIGISRQPTSSTTWNIGAHNIPVTFLENDDAYRNRAKKFTAQPDYFGFQRGYSISAVADITAKTGCAHEFKTYHGFTEKFEYCVHCDAKVKYAN